MTRKIIALLMAYCFFATSVWSLALPVEPLGRKATNAVGWRALRGPLDNAWRGAGGNLNAQPSRAAAMPKIFTNFAALNAPPMWQGGGGVSSTITSNFNGTAIPAGDTIWFSAVLKLNGSVPNHPVSIAVHSSTIQFTAGSTNYNLPVPNAVVTFSPTVTTTTATYDTANNPQPVWLENQLNPQPSGNTLLQAFAFPVPAGGLPGGIQNVTWTSSFSSDTSNINVNWQWAAAVYTGCVTTAYNSDDVKPTDDTNSSVYKNSDHAGTPEACKNSVAQGAMGGGGSNYTGSLSGTASVAPPVAAGSPVITGTISPSPNSNHWNNTNVTVSFSCSDANLAIAKCPAPVTVTTEGANQTITGTAVDQGGSTAQTSVTVNLDKTSPVITASATSSGGGGNVLTLPVTLTFTCTDALSGVASCPAPIQVTTAGADQVFSGTSTDKAGNTASTSIALNTENAPLAITGVLSPLPVNGWNKTDVSISYQCTGGVPAVSCPQAKTVTAEGANQNVSATATDAAGQSSTVSTTLNIDKTAPTISAAASPTPNPAGWNTTDVTITYTCSDALSGVSFCPSQHVVSTEGKNQQFNASATDVAGNTAPASTTINLEKTAPTITASQSPAPNAAGWNNSDVTVSFTCAASVSDIVSCATPVSVTTEGSGQQISGTVTDQAGKSNTATIPVNLDKTPPSIAITAPAASSFTNINHTPIAITYSDSGSGVDITTFQLLIDGVDHTAEFTTTATGATGSLVTALVDGTHAITAKIKDLAGNPATATTSFTVDTVAPVVTITQPASGIFTNATSTVVSGTVTDIAPVAVTVEGAAASLNGSSFSATVALGAGPVQTIHVSATDAAGNTATATVNVNIDRTPPVITATVAPPPNAAGWNNTNVVVTFACSDDDSGVATCPAPVSVSTEGANQQVSGQAVDKAGNTAQTTVTLKIDKTPPVITATAAPPANAAGWNTTSVTITYLCSDSLSGVVLCPPPQTVSSDGKAQAITGSVSDLAGNTASALVTLNIEQGLPTITASLNPPANAAGWNNADVTVSFVCSPAVSDIVSCQTPVTVSTEGKNQSVSGTVTDQAGKTATASATVNLDKTPPLISATASPAANAAGWNNTNVVINYVCSDTLSGIAFCPAPATVSSEGKAQNISAQATDQAGNVASVATTLSIDKTPPTITVTAAPPPNAAGWNNSSVTVSFACADSLSGVASCPAQQVVASEGQNQNISGQATDVAGNTATGTISLSIDNSPPTIVQITTPDHISLLHPGQVSVVANDNFTVAQLVISVNGNSLGTFTTPPYQSSLAVPAGAKPGDTLTVTVVATDQAGNSQTASRGVSVVADGGVIVGQVLDDATGLRLGKASVQMIAPTSSSSGPTDDQGRYSLLAADAHVFLSVSKNVAATPPISTTTVEREVFIQQGVGTVPVDVRLTTLATPVTIGSAGGTVSAGAISISVPAAAVSDGTSFQLTPLSGQGLPNLLPLGWSPLAAFDLRSSSSPANLPGVIAQLPNTTAHLVVYNAALHAWTMVAPSSQPVNGSLTFTVPAVGAYALVVQDQVTPPIPIPAVGSPLTGVPVQALDPAVSGVMSLIPPVLPAGGGTSIATLNLQAPSLSPSGTVVQTNVAEKFSLASGDTVSEETRAEDIVVYNGVAAATPSMLARFPVTPSHKYTNSQLLSGNIHLDILAGREGVRGQPGGNDPVTVTDGTATLSVPGGALGVDTAISVQSIALENFVPTPSSLSAVQEVLVDFSGEMLTTPAQLSIPSAGLNPAHTFLLTYVQRINGIPHMVAVAVAQINGANLTSVASPGLPGVTRGGEYVFYDIASPVGFVQGVAAAAAGPVQVLVQTDSLPIVSITGVDGRYIVPALAGTVNLKANGTASSVAGTASTQLTASQVATVNIQLNGVVNAATVTPADTSLGVPTSTVITVTSRVPINPATIAQSNLSLFQGTPAAPGAQVPLQPFVLSTAGTVLTFAPAQNLAAATQYTIQVTGLADLGGGAIVVPTSSFTTKAAQALTFDPNAITFAVPDQNGNIHVSAPAGSLPGGTKVLIIDQSNAVVLSLTAFNDGSLSGDFPGTISDILQVTATDPNGATASFTRSQFVAADGSVAVGPGGGTVTGPGGVELRIPEGALDKGATFKISSFGPDLFPERPDLPGSSFGGGIKFSSPDQPVFKKEVRLAFPRPAAAPPGAFFQVYRRMQGPGTQFAFEDVDYALPEGQGATAKVVTASFPYRGIIDFNGALAQASFQGQVLGGPLGGSAVEGVLDNLTILVWTVENGLPGISLGGVITGRVRYPVPPGGKRPDGTANLTGDTVFVGVPNLSVHTDRSSTRAIGTGATVAITQADGTYTFSDFAYRGGSVQVTATDGSGSSFTATAAEVVSLTDKTLNDFAGPLIPFYRNIAFADIVVPPPVPPPPTPQIGISFFTEDPTSNLRVPVTGVIASGTPLVIAFKTNGQITNPPSVRINNTSYPSQVDQPAAPGDPNTLDFGLSQLFVPGAPGIYTLTATGLTPFLQTISASKSFFVVAAGGNNNTITVGTPPIIAGVIPQAGSQNVPVNTFVQVQFSEPVTNLPGHVSLVPDNGSLTLSGIDYKTGVPIASLRSSDAVSSMTIEPATALKYNTHYTLQITSDVVDLNNVADPTKPALALVQPQDQKPPQVPYDFTTFGPTVLGSTPPLFSTRPVVFGNRAYLALSALMSQVKTYKVDDPTNPQELTTSTAAFVGRATDIAGEQNADVIQGGNLIAVTAGFASGDLGIPSNMWLFNVSGDQMVRVGGVSVTSSAINVGQAVRVALKGNFAYTTVIPTGGFEVVDLNQVISDYQTAFASGDPRTFGIPISTDGQGFANDAIVNTVPVVDDTGRNVFLWGIQAGDFLVAGSDPQNPLTQTLVVATGSAPGTQSLNPITFVVADPIQPSASAVLAAMQPKKNGVTLTLGQAVALGQINVPDANGNPVPKPIAVVVGNGTLPNGVMAVVDLTIPSLPSVLSLIEVNSFPLDVLLKDNMAIVGEADRTEFYDLTDPTNPFLAGSLSGIGGRLALSGFLYGASFAGSPLSGLHVAALGALAFVKSFNPSVIVVSPANELFDNVTINYAVIPPDPSITTAEVHIDVKNGGRVATLPGSLSGSTGSVTWPSGTAVQPASSYLATVHATSNGAELPTVPIRVPLVGVPIAVAPRDRMLRIQFALPDQNLFVDSKGQPIDKYTVKVYLNVDGSGSPAFQVTSTDIANAYANTDAWFSTTADGTGVPIVDGSSLATQAWVTRKIDKLSTPIGLNSPIRMQAFEIGTVLAQPTPIFIRVISEKTGRLVASVPASPNSDGNWSQIIDKVAGYVDANPTPTQVLIAGILDNAAMIFRVLHILDEASTEFGFGVLQGLLDGFKDGVEGDVNMVGSIFDAIRHPVKTAIGLYQFLGKVISALGQVSFSNILKAMSSGLGGLTWPSLDQTVMLAGKGGYFFGYLCGFIVEQALSAFILALVGAGVAALAEKVLAFLRGITWILQLAKDVAAVLRVMGYWLEVLAKAGADSKLAKGMLGFLRDSKAAIVALTDKYPAADKVLKALAKTYQVSTKLASDTLGWLNIVNKMADDAAERLVTFLATKGETESETLMARWLGFTNGKRSIADAAEAYDGFANLGEGAADAFVSAAEKVNTDTIKYTKQFGDKYKVTAQGDRVASSLGRVRAFLGDTRYSDDAIGSTVKILSDSSVVTVSDQAVEGAARFEQVAGQKFALADRENMLLEMGQSTQGADNMLKFAQSAGDDNAVAGMADMLQAAPCPIN